MKIKIFVAAHKEAAFPAASCFIPIQVGAANTSERFVGTKADNTGENISAKNPMYCELTAQYWAWKNEDADYFGLCHYRRYLNFSENEYDEDGWGNIIADSIDEASAKKYGLTDKAVEKAVAGQDIVLYKALDVTKFPVPSQSVRDHYNRAPHLYADDLDKMLSIIKRKYPEYFETAEKYLNGKYSHFCSMYVMKKEIFQRYNEFLFDILNEFEKNSDMRLYDIESIRTPGHLAERLLSIFVLQEKINNPSLNIKELQNVLFTHPERKICIIDPIFDSPKTIPVVFSSNDEFAPACAVAIESIIENSNKENYYDIIILEKNISAKNKKIIKEIAEQYSNISVRFAKIDYIVSKYKLQGKYHISIETFYRFLIQSILPEYEKVLYLDCDIVCKRDVADLFEIQIGNNLLAAVIDADMNGQLKLPGSDFFQYLSTELKLEDPYSYFQAGVLLMNLTEIRKLCSTDMWLREAEKEYRYQDQDILNKYCHGRVHYLDMGWNVLIEAHNYRVKELINRARWEIYLAYYKARENPYIIHYAGSQKPWNMRSVDFEDDFWKYAKNTPYYEYFLYNVLQRYIQNSADNQKTNYKAGISHKLPSTKRLVDKIINSLARSRIFPPDSRRRRIAQKVFHSLYK